MSNEIAIRQEEKALTTVRYPSNKEFDIFTKLAEATLESREFGVKTVGVGIVKAQFCWDFHLPLSVAHTSLYIVNGRIAVQSNLIASELKNKPGYDYEVIEHTNERCTIDFYCISKRTNEFEKVGTVTYGEEEAKKEGHDKKDTYKEIPKNMYFARAITNGYRWYIPNLFSVPVYTIEEFGFDENTIEAEYEEVEPIVEIEPDIPDYEYTLNKLLEEYSSDDILEQNNGSMPVTPEQINLVVHKLAKMDYKKIVKEIQNYDKSDS